MIPSTWPLLIYGWFGWLWPTPSRSYGQVPAPKGCRIRLSGRVVSEEIPSGLPGATVLVRATGQGTTTDAQGRHLLTGLSRAALSWRVQGTLKKSGYLDTPHYILENTSYRENNVSGDLHYDRKHWGAKVYYLKPDSVPIVRQRGAFPAYSYSQVRATFRGLDATLTYKLTDRLSLTSKTSLLFAFDHRNAGPAEDQDYLVYIPPNRTDNSLRYAVDKWGNHLTSLYAQVSGHYVARQTRAPAVTSRTENGRVIFAGDFAPPPPAYFLLGAEVGFSLAVHGQPVNVILSGNNPTNLAYRDYPNRFRYFADEIGRSINLKINVPFSIQ